jgi:calcineurin-like phosphoesterase
MVFMLLQQKPCLGQVYPQISRNRVPRPKLSSGSATVSLLYSLHNGIKVGVINISEEYSCHILTALSEPVKMSKTGATKMIIIDFHAEATSERLLLILYGRQVALLSEPIHMSRLK